MYAFNFFYLPYDDLFCLLYVPVTSLSFYMAFFCFLCMTNEYIIIWHTIYDKKTYVKILYYNNDIILNNSGIRQFKAKTISYIIFSNIVPSHKASTTSYDQSFSPNQFVFLRTKRGLFVWFFNAAFFAQWRTHEMAIKRGQNDITLNGTVPSIVKVACQREPTVSVPAIRRSIDAKAHS